MALIAALVILEHPREGASESLAADIIPAARRILPPRRMEIRESSTDISKPIKERPKNQFKPLDSGPINAKFTRQTRSLDTVTITPKLTTDADLLKPDFDSSLPRPTGASITKAGTSATRSDHGRADGASVGLSREAGIFETAMYWMARNITDKNKTGREDVVFLIDASGTMKDNINAVARHLSKMIDVFEESDLDYTLGVIRFNRILKVNDIKIFEQTSDVSEIKNIFKSIRCAGDERTLDAIEAGLTQVKFRDPVDKTFILVTDEAFTARTITRQTRKDLTLGDMLIEDFRDIVKMCQNDGVKVSILGIDDEMHKSLTKQTGGLWFKVPEQGNSL